MFYFWGTTPFVYCDSTVIQFCMLQNLVTLACMRYSMSQLKSHTSSEHFHWDSTRLIWYPLTSLRESRCCRIGNLVKFSLIGLVRIFNWCLRFDKKYIYILLKRNLLSYCPFWLRLFSVVLIISTQWNKNSKIINQLHRTVFHRMLNTWSNAVDCDCE